MKHMYAYAITLQYDSGHERTVEVSATNPAEARIVAEELYQGAASYIEEIEHLCCQVWVQETPPGTEPVT